MATTPLNFQVIPYRGGAATFDGAVTPLAATPTVVKLVKSEASQEDPAASYALSNVAGWLYTAAAVTEALVGAYYWYAEDASENILADGFVHIDADDTATYWGAKDKASAFAGRRIATRTVVSDTAAMLTEGLG